MKKLLTDLWFQELLEADASLTAARLEADAARAAAAAAEEARRSSEAAAQALKEAERERQRRVRLSR